MRHRQRNVSRPRAAPEHAEQAAFVAWAVPTLSQHGRRLFAVPNGAESSPEAWQWLASEGAVKGVPDLVIPGATPDGRFPGIVIEFKRPDGRGVVSPDQAAWLVHFAALGWLALIETTWQGAKAACEAAGYRDTE